MISQSEMSQTIQLSRYLGRNASQAEKTLFAELIVERINQRTLDGQTNGGARFKRYSEQYAAKKGVSRDSVDLFLEGDMLDSLEANVQGNEVKIEIGGNSVETAKGYNHQVGDTLPKRNWFGVTAAELRDIASQVTSNQPESSSTFTLAELQAALSQLGIEQSE